jgi:hypothetical protein
MLGISFPGYAKKSSASMAKSSTRIVVRVYDQAHVEQETLTEAGKEMSRIFHQAGIEALWIECLTGSTGAAQTLPDCQAGNGPAYLVLRIIRDPADAGAFARSALGFALTADKGTCATIFYGRVERLAKGRPEATAQLLGYVAAHEIGHVLLGSNSHSSSGMMGAPWNQDDLKRIRVGLLRFAADEEERMRREVSARNAVSQPKGPAI